MRCTAPRPDALRRSALGAAGCPRGGQSRRRHMKRMRHRRSVIQSARSSLTPPVAARVGSVALASPTSSLPLRPPLDPPVVSCHRLNPTLVRLTLRGYVFALFQYLPSCAM